ncbi:hypothetical protein OHAE_1341 [Ochrobactrum soli]|uniref:Uncharacterized protein n=1 Tax=Ochrobactrum soli TaxID=2448455 RepID=A0A2P9HN24_9HYPH|nr:hypothetical protein OHAE_1341 [[Ochrobactrum] soli]
MLGVSQQRACYFSAGLNRMRATTGAGFLMKQEKMSERS